MTYNKSDLKECDKTRAEYDRSRNINYNNKKSIWG